MVGKKEKNYQCRECGYIYSKRKIAEKCEKWCQKHKSCNLEIIQMAIGRKGK